MSDPRRITVAGPGDPQVWLFYEHGDWAVTEHVFPDGELFRVTHLPTGYAATHTYEYAYFTFDQAVRIVERFAKELPRRKSAKGMMKHRKLAAKIIREECEREVKP
jgi:hypothetical protein